MNKFIVIIYLVLNSVHSAFSQVDSSSFKRDEIKQQAIELRNKVNHFVNQSTAKSAEYNKPSGLDSVFRFMIEMKSKFSDLQNKLDSVKENQSALLKYNAKLERKIKIYKDYPNLPSQNENKNKRVFIIYFKSASAVVDPLFIADLKEWIQTIPVNMQVQINGYADDLGAKSKNLTLSMLRAKNVQLLVNQLASIAIKTKCNGKGVYKPLAKLHQPLNRQLRRRVLLFY